MLSLTNESVNIHLMSCLHSTHKNNGGGWLQSVWYVSGEWRRSVTFVSQSVVTCILVCTVPLRARGQGLSG